MRRYRASPLIFNSMLTKFTIVILFAISLTAVFVNFSVYAAYPAPLAYIEHYRVFCYSNNVYWFDSMENARDIYKKCADENFCTVDLCADSDCKNTLKCDGSTCSKGSADYNKYCETEGGTTEPQIAEQSSPEKNQSLLISLLAVAKEEDNFQETIVAESGSKVLFQTEIENKSAQSMENASLKIVFSEEISFGGALSIDSIESAGDIISGITIGTIPNGITKKISFYGNIKKDIPDGETKITATVSSGNIYNEDSAIVKIGKIPETKSGFIAALENTSVANFVIKKYPWFITGAILVILFSVIYKKLSSEA